MNCAVVVWYSVKQISCGNLCRNVDHNILSHEADSCMFHNCTFLVENQQNYYIRLKNHLVSPLLHNQEIC